MREWARANGYDVPDRGRIPAAIRDAWQQAAEGGE
ncbi:histone-like nucleoid-structuring protein Lsr2 [Streptomyces canus]